MIIKEIKLGKGLLFKNKIFIVTEEKKIYLDADWNEKVVEDLNFKLEDFRVENVDDFVSLKEKLKDDKKYLIFENGILNSSRSVWKFLNPKVNQVPRPVSVIFRKEKGVKEFVVFSLNARNFPVALGANGHVADRLRKKLRNIKQMSDGDILMGIKEAVDEEHALVDFEIRLGIVFNNYKNGGYIYADKKLTAEEQFGYVSKLIDSYDLVYIENPFSEKDLEMYKKLTEKYRKKGLICMNYFDYSKWIDKKLFNCVIPKFDNVAKFKNDVDLFKKNKLNIIAEGKKEFIDVVVALEIPLVKLNEDKGGDSTANKLNRIHEEIFNKKVSDKKSQVL